ncbi:monocarboxylate transporter 12-like [Haliotis rufescens]|uniref:monocarboxylate transporter 12-like n=1 Tax=Haliotis rufescens TaxID=6454 RepID=UPI00201EA7E7|nr:monocarboxylate transporter 12-like [Haliotis rufescens]
MKSDPLSEGGRWHPCSDRKTTDGVVRDEGMQRQEDEEAHGEAQMTGDGSERRQLCHQKNCNGEKGSCVVEKDVHSDEEEMQGDTMDYGIYKWVVVFSCFFQHVITGGFERSDGVLYLKLISKFNQSAQATAWVGSLATTLRLVLSPLSSAVSNRFSSRVATMTGGIIMTVGVLISGFAPNLIFLYISYGIIGGIGRSLTYGPGIVTVGQYFARKPGMAVGIATSGAGIGTFFLPPLADFLFEEFHFFGAFLILSGIAFNFCICGALYRPLALHKEILGLERNTSLKPSGYDDDDDDDDVRCDEYGRAKEEDAKLLVQHEGDVAMTTQDTRQMSESEKNDKEIFTDGSITLKPTGNYDETTCWHRTQKCLPKKIEKPKKNQEKSNVLDLSLLKNLPFLFFCLSIVLFTMSFKSVFTFLPALAKSRGCTDIEAALLLSIAGVLDTIGRILVGFILELKQVRRFRPYAYSGVLFVIALASFVCPALHAFWQFCIISGVYGAMTGAYVSQKGVVVVDILGIEKLSSSFGILLCFQGIGALIGPPLSGMMKDVFGDYSEAFYLGGGMTVLAGIIMVGSNILLVAQRRKQSPSVDACKSN